MCLNPRSNSQDFISNSPYCLPYNLSNASLENLELDQLMNYGQLADGPTRRRIKSSRDVGELVLNPIQLIRS